MRSILVGLFDAIRRLLTGQADGAARDSAAPPPQQGHGLDEIARRLRIPAEQLLATRPAYQTYTIPKRRGGTRTIDAPAPALKSLQHIILRRLLARLRAHPAAMGFEKGKSIATHALLHTNREVVLRMDIRDFFPATSAQRVLLYFRHIGYNHDAASLLVNLCAHEGRLPQGAPTSPRLSNLVNYAMDARLAALAGTIGRHTPVRRNPKTLASVRPPSSGAAHLDVFYTRYADDLSFSFSHDHHEAVQNVIQATQSIVADYGYHLHTRKKLRIMRRHDRQQITGLVVNAGVLLPRHTRRRLRAVEHHHATGRSATLTPQQLEGWRALQRMILTQTVGG